MCDLAVAADTARFALPGINFGVFCATPAVGVVRNVARKRAMEMLLTGDTIDAATALDWGLVNRVVAGRRTSTPRSRRSRIGSSPAARRSSHWASALLCAGRPSARVAYEGTTEAMAWNLLDQDAFEGMDAFLEKRAAKWRSGF